MHPDDEQDTYADQAPAPRKRLFIDVLRPVKRIKGAHRKLGVGTSLKSWARGQEAYRSKYADAARLWFAAKHNHK